MTGSLCRRLIPVWIAVLTWFCLSPAAPAICCPFCGMQGQTLTGEVNQASMVLFGTLTNARLDPNGGFGQGATDLRIEAIIKKHEILGDQKVITLPRYVPTDNNKSKFLIFCDVFKGKIDPYRGVPVKANSDMVKYLQIALALKDKDINTRLKFFFDYLDNADLEISNDAYREFGNADYKDYRDMARDLPADKIAKWLQDPDTPTFRFGLYGSMLGHCGTAKHADLLRKLLDDPDKRLSSGVDGVLAGYILLQPKEGWAYLRGILRDPSKEFMLRYAALRSARFFWDSEPKVKGKIVVDKKDVVLAVCLLLEQNDIADLAIEDLRKWNCWDMADRVLPLYDQKSHDIPIVKRAILRFALNCPQTKDGSLVQRVRKQDPELVKDVEELLKLETSVPPAKPPVASK
jgi:hypothetical protein